MTALDRAFCAKWGEPPSYPEPRPIRRPATDSGSTAITVGPGSFAVGDTLRVLARIQNEAECISVQYLQGACAPPQQAQMQAAQQCPPAPRRNPRHNPATAAQE